MYEIETYEEVIDQLAAIPLDLLAAYAELLELLRLAPWSGEPYSSGKPDGAIRQIAFGSGGRGVVVYLVLEPDRRVDILRVFWME